MSEPTPLRRSAKYSEKRDFVNTSSPLILRDCQLVNVYSGEIYTTSIRIDNGLVTSIEPAQEVGAAEIIDCSGLFALPGLIEPHMHVESTGLWPDELAQVLVPLGTTTVVVDGTNPLHTGGPSAVRSIIDGFDGLPLRAFVSIPSYAPIDASRETTAYQLQDEDLKRMLNWPEAVSIGEVVSSKLAGGDREFVSRVALSLAHGLRASGHGNDLPLGDEAALDAYATAGIGDDHGARTPAEVLGRLGRGISLLVVETPTRHNFSEGVLDYLVANGTPLRSLHYCVDNITAGSILSNNHGYLERSLRLAIQAGVPPVEAVRMGTLNPARYYRKETLLGSIAPGRVADILLVERLDRFPPRMVLVGGRIVARDGEMVEAPVKTKAPDSLLGTVKLHESVTKERLNFIAPAGSAAVVVRVVALPDENRAGNTSETAALPVVNGVVHPDLPNDILKICMVERYGRNGNVAVGFIRGFGLKRGALASSMSLPSNNIVAVGTNDSDLWLAIKHVAAIGGGNVVVADGEVIAEVRFPVAGIISTSSSHEVVAALENADRVVHEVLGCERAVPFWTMSATVLHTAPEVGLTDYGLFDVASGEFVETVVEVTNE